jgi:hypothetical protein
MIRKQNQDILRENDLMFRRSSWKNVFRLFGFFLVFWLDLGWVLTLIDRIGTGKAINFGVELITLVLILFFNLTILAPALLEADWLEAEQDFLIIKTMFWKYRIKWLDIKEIRQPRFLKFSILKTSKLFFLLNRTEIKRYEQLYDIIVHKANLIAT